VTAPRRKWRPSLALTLALTLAAVLCLPLAGIVAVRYLFPVIGYQEAVIAVGVGVVLVTAVVGWALWRLLLRPITALAFRAEAVKRGAPGAGAPLAHYGTQEMERMGRAVMEMGRVLQSREAVLRSYADHATHELKSPLTVLRGAAELLDSDGLSAEDRARLLERIDEAADRMTALLDAQRMLARAQEPLAGGESRIAPLMEALQMDHGALTLVLEADATLPMAAHGVRLVLDHLLSNAAAHGARVVRIRAVEGALRVADDGPGVSEGNRDRIFDPFFTTRREAGGTGMGLPIVRRMLEAHGAQIRLEEGGAGHGAVFVVEFQGFE